VSRCRLMALLVDPFLGLIEFRVIKRQEGVR